MCDFKPCRSHHCHSNSLNPLLSSDTMQRKKPHHRSQREKEIWRITAECETAATGLPCLSAYVVWDAPCCCWCCCFTAACGFGRCEHAHNPAERIQTSIFFSPLFLHWRPTPCIVALTRPPTNQWPWSCLRTCSKNKIKNTKNKREGKRGSVENRRLGRRKRRMNPSRSGKRASDGKLRKGGPECVSRSSGAHVPRPTASVGPGPGPRRHRPAAASIGSSSWRRPDSYHLPFFRRLNIKP